MKTWMIASLLASSCFAGSSYFHEELRANADQAYAGVNFMPPLHHGWLGEANKKGLNRFIREKKPQVVIEIGSWLGNSTIFMAQRLPAGAQLYAIDHFEGSPEHYQDSSLASFLPTLYDQFLSNVIHAGVASTIIPIKQSSEQAFNFLKGNIKADLIYIDAAHDTQSVYKDITMYAQLLEEDGVLCGDDWQWDSVKAAVMRYAQENGKQFISHDNFWYLQEFPENVSLPRWPLGHRR